MNLTYFPNAHDTTALPADLDWSEFAGFLREAFDIERHRADKLDCPAFISGLCEGKRSNSNIRHLSFLAGDFDIAPDDRRYMTFHDRCDWLDDYGYLYVAYTTTTNTDGHNRYRIISPLGCDVPATHWLAVWSSCNDVFGGCLDPATKDPARLSFLPAQWHGNNYWDAGKRARITLTGAVNAFRTSPSGASRPILTSLEIEDVIATFQPQAKVRCRLSIEPSTSYQASRLTADEIESLAHGHGADSRVWSFIGKLSSSPLVSRWLRESLPTEAGSRDHRFCLYAAQNAIRDNIPITPAILAALASEWSQVHLHRPAPADIERQAENALAWAIRAPKEQPADTSAHQPLESKDM